MRRIRSLVNYLAIIYIACSASMVNAITFGDIKVYSYLDEPLNAELEVTDMGGMDPNTLIVSLASANDFVRANLQRTFFLTTLTFDVQTYQDRVFVWIRSNKVVKSPYLELLIHFEWPNGSFIKDYTMLLDPPPRSVDNTQRPVPYSSLAENQTSQKLFPSDIEKIKREGAANKANVTTQSKPQTQQITTPQPGNQTQPTLSATTQPNNTTQPQQPTPSTTQQPPANFDTSSQYQKTNFQKQVDRTQAYEQKTSESLLDAAVAEVKELDALVDTTADLDQIAAKRQKHLDMYKDVVDSNEPEIDFGEVIKPAGSKPDAARAVAVPGKPMSATGAPVAAAPPQRASGSITLLLTGFLLGAVIVLGIGLKKGWHKKLLARHVEQADVITPLQTYDEEFDMEIDLDVAHKNLMQHEITEEIELTALPADKVTSQDVNLDEFERELASLSAEKFGSDAPSKKMPVKTVSELLNIGDLIKTDMPSVTQTPVQPAQPSEPLESPEPLPKVTVETTTADTGATEPQFNFDEIEATITVDNAKAQAEQQVKQSKLLDNVSAEAELKLVDEPQAPANKPKPTELKLENETADVSNTELSPEEQAIKLKIDLAKKYLEAGDKDTARLLLKEIIATAKDKQKLEAEIILSGIL